MTNVVDPFLPPLPSEIDVTGELGLWLDNMSRVIEQLSTVANTAFRPVYKKTSETKNTDTTLAADGELKFRVAANDAFAVRALIVFDTTASADFKFGFRGPSSPSLVRLTSFVMDAGETALEVAKEENFSTTTTLASTGGDHGLIRTAGVIVNGSNAGEVSFQWAQGTSHANDTTVRLGSVIEYVPL